MDARIELVVKEIHTAIGDDESPEALKLYKALNQALLDFMMNPLGIQQLLETLDVLQNAAIALDAHRAGESE